MGRGARSSGGSLHKGAPTMHSGTSACMRDSRFRRSEGMRGRASRRQRLPGPQGRDGRVVAWGGGGWCHLLGEMGSWSSSLMAGKRGDGCPWWHDMSSAVSGRPHKSGDFLLSRGLTSPNPRPNPAILPPASSRRVRPRPPALTPPEPPAHDRHSPEKESSRSTTPERIPPDCNIKLTRRTADRPHPLFLTRGETSYLCVSAEKAFILWGGEASRALDGALLPHMGANGGFVRMGEVPTTPRKGAGKTAIPPLETRWKASWCLDSCEGRERGQSCMDAALAGSAMDVEGPLQAWLSFPSAETGGGGAKGGGWNSG